ncbi:MAG: TetR/AcrR family transcriptional regulator [Tissierellia bacterium]|nr:TetR/AcrR family transcriptional regulator [Tissierellia bacterium]
MKFDRRILRTRESIFNAFHSLLAEKTYNKITVQEIIDRANIGRSTFYAHFTSKDHLLEEVGSQLFHHIFTDSPERHPAYDDSNPDTIRHTILHTLIHLEENKKSLEGLLCPEAEPMLYQYFAQDIYTLIQKAFPKGEPWKKKNIPEAFLIHHTAFSFFQLLKWWYENDCKESPEELTRYYLAVMEPLYT